MKTQLLYSLALLLLNFGISNAQLIGSTERSQLNEDLEPFYHGVASGDPTSSSVIIWTKVTPRVAEPVEVLWRVARDTTFSSTVRSGSIIVDESSNWSAKIDVTGLQPNTFYYYEFNTYGKNSLIGRTKTAPDGSIGQLRFATVSCSNYNAGFFNAYDQIVKRNDIDAVLHLGDYIYEYAGGIGDIRQAQPEKEILELADYRLRYSTYRLDPMLQRIHQQYPMIVTWDDHEVANNTWRDGAQNHNAGEGPFPERKSAAQIAHNEWMPTRLPEPGNVSKLWRKFSYGNLAEIFVLDTRHYDRDEENVDLANDPTRKLLGDEQFAWLEEGLKNSTAQWKILAQQVMIAPLTPFGLTLNPDQWDGYIAERTRLYDFILNNDIKNVVVLTGDIHTAWANDLPYNRDNYNAISGEGSVAVEFVCTSITSTSSPVAIPPSLYGVVRAVLPHVKYVNLFRKGYSLLDLTPERTTNDFYYIKTIRQEDEFEQFEQGWFVANGNRRLQRRFEPTTLLAEQQYQAPPVPRSSTVTTVNDKQNAVLVAVYPNPFISAFQVQFNTFSESRVVLSLYNAAGQLAMSKDLGVISKGLHSPIIEVENQLPKGLYKMVIQSGSEVIERSIVKM